MEDSTDQEVQMISKEEVRAAVKKIIVRLICGTFVAV